MLKYPSSAHSLFYWMQEASDDNDTSYAERINSYIKDQDLLDPARSDVATVSDMMEVDTVEQSEPIAQPTESSKESSEIGAPNSDEINSSEAVRNLLATISAQAGFGGSTVDLCEILKPSNLTDLLCQEGVIDRLMPYMPPDTPNNLEGVLAIVSSPQYAQALRSFSQALNSPGGVNIISALGLSLDESANPNEGGALQFLKAIARFVSRNNGSE